MSDVMVIDANDDSIAMLGWYLSLNGHEIRRATTVVEAFDQISERAPDAMIIDLDLPGMSGHEFLSSLRLRGLAADAQVVMLGEQSDARTAIRSWEPAQLTTSFDRSNLSASPTRSPVSRFPSADIQMWRGASPSQRR